MSYGVSASARDEVSNRPLLYYAVAHANEAMCRALLGKGASPNFEVTDTQSLLAFAIASDAVRATRIPEMLMTAGADVRAHEWEGGCSPLEVAVQAQDLERVLELLSAGADPRQSAQTGKPLVYAAASTCNDMVTRALKEAGADINATIDTSALSLAPPTSAGAGAAAGSHTRCSLLHHAVRSSWPKVAHSLLRAGARVGDRNEVGCTVLMVLAQYAAHTRPPLQELWLALLRTALASSTVADLDAVDDIGMTVDDYGAPMYASAGGASTSTAAGTGHGAGVGAGAGSSGVLQFVAARRLQLADPTAARVAAGTGGALATDALPRPSQVGRGAAELALLPALRPGETRFPGEEAFAGASTTAQLLAALDTMRLSSDLKALAGPGAAGSGSLASLRQRLVGLFKTKRVRVGEQWTQDVANGVGDLLRALISASATPAPAAAPTLAPARAVPGAPAPATARS